VPQNQTDSGQVEQDASFLTVDQFAHASGIPRGTTYDRVVRGEIKALKVTVHGPLPATEARGARGFILIPASELARVLREAAE